MGELPVDTVGEEPFSHRHQSTPEGGEQPGNCEDAEQCGRGVGRGLVGRAVDHARSKGTAVINALVAPDNLPSRRVFEELGFEPTARYTSIGCPGREWHRQVELG